MERTVEGYQSPPPGGRGGHNRHIDNRSRGRGGRGQSRGRGRGHHTNPRPPFPPVESMTPQQLKSRLGHLERVNATLLDDLKYKRGRAEKKHSQSDVQLESLKEFLDTHDKSGLADVLGNLELINDLVDQLAADVADQFQAPLVSFKASAQPDEPATRTPASLRLVSLLGERIVQVLESCDPQHPSIQVLLQYAVQSAALHALANICDTSIRFAGSFGDKANPAVVLNDLAQRIQSEEIQPIYARWRVLTHQHLRATVSPEYTEDLSRIFVDDLSRTIVDIRDAISGTECSVDERSAFCTTIINSLSDLHKNARRFSVMIREAVVTTDYAVSSPAPGTNFESSIMDFPYETAKSPNEVDKVVGVVRFGLISRGKPGREQAEIEDKHLKKAQVFTEHVLQEILGFVKSS